MWAVIRDAVLHAKGHAVTIPLRTSFAATGRTIASSSSSATIARAMCGLNPVARILRSRVFCRERASPATYDDPMMAERPPGKRGGDAGQEGWRNI